ncbi:MAG: diacylglycerol kinase [Bacteroidia bacterium]|nr:diacylglycerol kinase [Bacteroidia bacterium]
MKYFLIMNPMSHGGKSKKKFTDIFQMLNNVNINYEYKETKSMNDAYELSLEANKKNYDIIVAVGGDGTINQVLNGFFNKEGKRISDTKFGIIYTGTSPDFCKSYNIPVNIKDAVEVLSLRNTRKIQIGKASFSAENIKKLDGKSIDANDLHEVRYFGCCANIGLGAALARSANSGIRKYLGDFFGTFISLFKILIVYKANDSIVVRGEKKHIIKKLYNISVGRTKYIASGIQVANDLADCDGRFYCLTVSKLNLFNTFCVIKRVYSGKKFDSSDFLSLEYLKNIEIYGNYLNPEIEFDGDPAGFLPCRIEIAEDELDLIVRG